MGEKFKMVKFLRRTSNRYSKLGKGRKKKQKWRKPRGRDNKMREKRKGYPVVVTIGHKKGERLRGIIKNKKPIMIRSIKDFEKLKKNEIAVIGNIGKKKKIELAKKAKDMKIQIHNLNIEKFLKENIKKQKTGKKKSEVSGKKK